MEIETDRPRTKKYPNSVIAEGIEMWRNGCNQTEIVTKLGVNHVTVNRWITELWFGYRGDFGWIEVRQSAINQGVVVEKVQLIVKLKRKPTKLIHARQKEFQKSIVMNMFRNHRV